MPGHLIALLPYALAVLITVAYLFVLLLAGSERRSPTLPVAIGSGFIRQGHGPVDADGEPADGATDFTGDAADNLGGDQASRGVLEQGVDGQRL